MEKGALSKGAFFVTPVSDREAIGSLPCRHVDEFSASGLPSTGKSSVCWDPLQTLGVQGEQASPSYTT